MISSSSFEVTLLEGTKVVRSFHLGAVQLPFHAGEPVGVRGDRSPTVRILRKEARTAGRLRLETETIFFLPEQRHEIRLGLSDLLRDEFGLATLRFEEQVPGEEEAWTTPLQIELLIDAPSELKELHARLVAELASLHTGLVMDVVSRTRHRWGRGAMPEVVRPEEEIAVLESALTRLSRSIERIAAQPSTTLSRTRSRARWRPGDVLDAKAMHELATTPGTRFSSTGRLVAVGPVHVRRSLLSKDLPEHRQIREGIRRLAARSSALAAYCDRSAGLLEGHRQRWGEKVFEERFAVKIRRLGDLSATAREIEKRFLRQIDTHEFLEQAGPPRRPFGPTPVFMGRPAYREAYATLQQVRRRAGALVEGEDTYARLRSLSELYEYWCFIRVVQAVRERLGAPGDLEAVELVDDVYRPDLEPGQKIVFSLPQGGSALVHYEPDFPPVLARDRSEVFRAALVSAPLRPDIVLELRRPDQPTLMLALDAKSTSRFENDRLFQISDYRTLVHDPKTGHQPIRQLFLLHRDVDRGPFCTLPGYLEGRFDSAQASIVGAIPCVPDQTRALDRVIDRFLEIAQVAVQRG